MPVTPETDQTVRQSETARLCDKVEAYIVSRPLKAMLISLLAGFIFSRVVL